MKMVYGGIVQEELFLRQVSEQITPADDIDYIVKELTKAASFYGDKAFGVCGIQLGINRRIFISQIEGKHKVYLNPEIIVRDGLHIFKREGCLSYPNRRYLDTWRYSRIAIRYDDRDFRPMTLNLDKALPSVVVQHEIDHMNGVLYFDKIKSPVANKFTIGKDETCVCGSGKTFRKCCMEKYE